jgi:hypothetical protein
MRPMIRMLVLAAVFVSATVAFAIERVVVNVPFSFRIHDKTFPGGAYEVDFDSIYHTLKLSSTTDTKVSYCWIASPADFSPNMSTLSLKFDGGADDIHVLRSIRLETWSTQVLTLRKKHFDQHEASITGSR